MSKAKGRYSTHFWVGREVAQDFKDACQISGRRTCDVVEPLMEAYTELVKNKALKKVDVCPFKAIDIHIDTLKIMQKYEPRGPKLESGKYDDILLVCQVGGKPVHFFGSDIFTCQVCKLGGNNYKYKDEEMCKVYVKNMWRTKR